MWFPGESVPVRYADGGVDGIHAEGNRLEFGAPDVRHSPVKLAEDIEVAHGLPVETELQSDVNRQHVVGEIVGIGGGILARHEYLTADGSFLAEVAQTLVVVIDLTLESLLEVVAEVGSETEVPPGAHAQGGSQGNGDAPHLGVGDVSSSEVALRHLAVLLKPDVVVLDIGIGMEAFPEEVCAETESPSLANHAVAVYTEADASAGAEAVDFAHFCGQGQRCSATDDVAGPDDESAGSQSGCGAPFRPVCGVSLQPRGASVLVEGGVLFCTEQGQRK